MNKKVFFITGTDTEVGKTTVSCGILANARSQGLRTAAIKPVAAGCEESPDGPRNDDALGLQAVVTLEMPYHQVNPVALMPAVAPHIAAAEAGKRLSADRLAGFCRGVLMQSVDLVVIEGAGGWRVPLNERETFADVAKELDCAVILVVAMRLGCLNHALLSAEAIYRDGLRLAGWVANSVDPDMPRLEENIATLRDRLAAPCLGVVPRLADPTPELVGQHLQLKEILENQHP